ncbi:MAG: hypothetical protein ACI4SO_02885 [Muribaculaceae bacterium]
MNFPKHSRSRGETIKCGSPSHNMFGVGVTRRRRYAPCLVLSITACSPSLPDGGGIG